MTLIKIIDTAATVKTAAQTLIASLESAMADVQTHNGDPANVTSQVNPAYLTLARGYAHTTLLNLTNHEKAVSPAVPVGTPPKAGSAGVPPAATAGSTAAPGSAKAATTTAAAAPGTGALLSTPPAATGGSADASGAAKAATTSAAAAPGTGALPGK